MPVNEDSKFYIDGSRDQGREYDSRIFWLSGGAIALSGALLQTFIGRDALELTLRWLLPVSWGLLLLAIIITMVSLQVSMRMCTNWVRYLEHSDSASANRALALASWVNGLNYASLASVAVGIGGLGWFFYVNLPLL